MRSKLDETGVNKTQEETGKEEDFELKTSVKKTEETSLNRSNLDLVLTCVTASSLDYFWKGTASSLEV